MNEVVKFELQSRTHHCGKQPLFLSSPRALRRLLTSSMIDVKATVHFLFLAGIIFEILRVQHFLVCETVVYDNHVHSPKNTAQNVEQASTMDWPRHNCTTTATEHMISKMA